MAIPFLYSVRSLRVRWKSTVGTVACVALVVAVFVTVMSLANGLKATYISSGDPRNLLILRQGSMAESSSQVTVENVRQAQFLEGIATDERGERLVSAEIMVLITLPRVDGGKAHVQVRGLGPQGLKLRPTVHFVEGHMFSPGKRECIVSRNLASRYPDLHLGNTFRFGKNAWTVVGIMEVSHTAYDSEVWVDADEARKAFNRTFYGSILLRPVDAAAAQSLKERIERDQRLHLRVLTEAEYYLEQTKTAAPIRLFGAAMAAIMSLGAAFSAMNTLYASVGARTRDIGTLRVLGFKPPAIYILFVFESLVLGAIGGIVGCLLSLPMHGVATGTFNWATFAEVAFEFRITPALLGAGMLFALVMGVVGSLLPAGMAARKPVLEALHSV
ncbi:MAG TPA: ABC transporter permease [Candidatus Limnocylindria bacterium]|jgi:putative ABC transport system permease protein|nr:ABC transporter permease [Candidatus Limnocylindria bacterium]